MNKRLTESQRIKLEARLQVLREVTAALEPDKLSGIVDKAGPEQKDIKGIIVSIMKLMDAKPEAASYHTASIKTLLKKAFAMTEEAPPEDPEMDPGMDTDTAEDFEEPMGMVQDLSSEVQNMDDHRLVQEVKQLEQHMKEDLAKLPAFPGAEALGGPPAGGPPVLPPAGPPSGPPAPSAPAAAGGPDAGPFPLPPKGPVAPKGPAGPPPPMAEEAPEEESEDEAAPFPSDDEEAPDEELGDEAPPEEESNEEESDDESDDEDDKPELKPEQKLALLMSLPKKQRLAKAAQLKALAGVLESDERQVSQDNKMVGNPNDELAHDYEGEEDGSMKDVKAANLKTTVRQLLAALEDSTTREVDDVKDKSMDKEAVLKLALRHLEASIEDMQEAAEEPEKPEIKKEATKAERVAILKARLNSLQHTATVDGKSMSTPKEVPKPNGTTEDNLHGDAKIQYSTNNGEDGTEVINDRRTPIKDPVSVAGTDEPNEIYFSNNPEKDRYKPTTESDSSKDKNNKRVLKDMGTAVQVSSPSSSTDNMEMGVGSHQKEKTWEKAKSESDITPTGDRLVGLAELNEIIKTRTDRAVKLAGKMADLGLIKTEAQLGEKIAELASMDDSQFTVVASFLSTSLTKDSVPITRKPKVAGELPPWLDKDKKDDGDNDDSDDSDEDDSEEEDKHEASLVRRASQEPKITRRAERGGLKTPLMSGTDAIINHRASSFSRDKSYIAEALSKVAWTDPEVEARKKADLDKIFNGK